MSQRGRWAPPFPRTGRVLHASGLSLAESGILVRGATRSHRPWSIALNFAGVVCSVVGTPTPFIDSSLRVWAKGAGHVDDATFVDSGGGDRFWGLILFAPTFERSELIELIGAGASPAMAHPGNHKKTKPVVLVRAHVF